MLDNFSRRIWTNGETFQYSLKVWPVFKSKKFGIGRPIMTVAASEKKTISVISICSSFLSRTKFYIVNVSFYKLCKYVKSQTN